MCVFVYHEITGVDWGTNDRVTLPCDQLEAFSYLFLRVARDCAYLLEGAWHLLLSAGNVETGSGHCIVCSALQMLLLVDLLEQSITTVL